MRQLELLWGLLAKSAELSSADAHAPPSSTRSRRQGEAIVSHRRFEGLAAFASLSSRRRKQRNNVRDRALLIAAHRLLLQQGQWGATDLLLSQRFEASPIVVYSKVEAPPNTTDLTYTTELASGGRAPDVLFPDGATLVSLLSTDKHTPVFHAQDEPAAQTLRQVLDGLRVPYNTMCLNQTTRG